MKKPLVVAMLATAFLGFDVGPVRADPARPSNYVSEVTAVTPEVPAEFEVVGGDSFLQVTGIPGHIVEIPGYQAEPYIRIEADGTVLINERSPSHWINDDRYARVSPPPDADFAASPGWVSVGSGGRYAWHDHRIHWMTPESPPPVVGDVEVEVLAWSVPVMVDGTSAEVAGSLRWLPPTNPVPPLAVGLLAAAPLAALARRRPAIAAAGLLTVGGAAALVVGLTQLAASPPGAGGEVLMWAPPALALAGGIVSLARRGRGQLADMAAAVGITLLAVWVLLRLATLWMPSLVSDLPAPVERALVATAAVTVLVGIGAVIGSRLGPPRHRPVTPP